ncbi:hypothetical protein NL676_014696 [Syzygium grande]|nr:hypothetical protein NL676_014696 [Syzygium grande]
MCMCNRKSYPWQEIGLTIFQAIGSRILDGLGLTMLHGDRLIDGGWWLEVIGTWSQWLSHARSNNIVKNSKMFSGKQEQDQEASLKLDRARRRVNGKRNFDL